jgi:hypothetical protein
MLYEIFLQNTTTNGNMVQESGKPITAQRQIKFF